MKKTVFPDMTLQKMRDILSQGSNHGYFLWAMCVLDATLIRPKNVPFHPSDAKKYLEGYNLRESEILLSESE